MIRFEFGRDCLMLQREISPIQNHQHGLPYLHQGVYCLALDHNGQLVFGNGDGDILMHKQHQWLCSIFE